MLAGRSLASAQLSGGESQMAEADKKQGYSDSQQGKGQRDPASFGSDQARKDYQAGWNQGNQSKK